MAMASKPTLAQFLESNARQHKGKLNLDSLLIMPIQRIPRYELLIKELLKYTDSTHEDHTRLHIVLDKIKKFALHIDCASVDPNDCRDIEIEGWAFGLGHLIRHDIVSLSVNSSNVRKERALFLFADSLVIASVKKKSTRKPSSNVSYQPGNSYLEGYKFKLLMRIQLTDVQVLGACPMSGGAIMGPGSGTGCRGSLGLSGNEAPPDSDDLKILHRIMELATSLKCPHGPLEEVLKEMIFWNKHSCDIECDPPLELEVKTSDNSDCSDIFKILFGSCDKKSSWLEALQEALDKFVRYGFGKQSPVQFLQALPIRKTRAGLQLSCATPVALINKSNKLPELTDIWVANSDGYVGQICILTLHPEPAITSCNGVCNARITCILSVPPRASIHGSWPGLSEPHSTLTTTTTTVHHSHQHSHDGHDYVGLSPGHSAPANVHPQGYESEDETSKLRVVGHKTSLEHWTVWLGTEDGGLHVYDCSDNVRVKKNRHKIQHKSPLNCIVYFDNRVFVALGDGDVAIYNRNQTGTGWSVGDPNWMTIGTAVTPVTKMLCVGPSVWCATGSQLKVYSVNIGVLELLNSIQVTIDGSQIPKGITNLVTSQEHVWVAVHGSSVIKGYSPTSYTCVMEVNVASEVTRILAGCDDIIRQHKSACLRVTALMVATDKTLWVGTSAGVILHGLVNIDKITCVPLPHGHTGQVRFLTSCSNRGSLTVISGGDGCEEFKPNSHGTRDGSVGPFSSLMTSMTGGDSSSDQSGREDSTNHLLIWKIKKI